MAEMTSFLQEYTKTKTREKVLVRRESDTPTIKFVNSISIVHMDYKEKEERPIVKDDLIATNEANKRDSVKESCSDKKQEEPSFERSHESRTIWYYLNHIINKKTIDNWVKHSGIYYTPKDSKGKKKKKGG